MYTHVYLIALPYSRNYHNIVGQLHLNKIKFLKIGRLVYAVATNNCQSWLLTLCSQYIPTVDHQGKLSHCRHSRTQIDAGHLYTRFHDRWSEEKILWWITCSSQNSCWGAHVTLTHSALAKQVIWYGGEYKYYVGFILLSVLSKLLNYVPCHNW